MSLITKIFNKVCLRTPPLGVAIFIVLSIIPIFSNNLLIREILIAACFYAIFAMSWDIFSGFTQDTNFGHAFFIGGSGYVAGLIGIHLRLPIPLTILVGGALAGAFGIIVGNLTLRLRGAYFALATFTFSAVLYKLSIIWSGFTGGEEGLSGISSLSASPQMDYYIILLVTVLTFLFLKSFANYKYGIILRSIGSNEEAAEASGINTAYYKVLAFTISGTIAGIGGATFAHWQMQVDPSMLGTHLSGNVILLAVAGGMGTIIGPMLAAIALEFLNEWLRIFSEYRIVIYTGILILAIYIVPDGFMNQRIIKESKSLKKFLLGEIKRHEQFRRSKS